MLETTTHKHSEKTMKLTFEELSFSRVIESIVEQWGFKPLMGQVWALLYLREKPLSPSQIEDELGLSKGNVNGLINELLKWGVAQKVRIPGDRNYYYEVEQEIWKSISNVIVTREARILSEAIDRVTVLEETLKSVNKTEKTEHQLKRFRHVREALETAQTLTNLLIKASPEKLASVAKIVSKLRNL